MAFQPSLVREGSPIIDDAFTQSDYAINITDPGGVLLTVNPAYLRLYKIPDEAAILGQTQRIIRSPETPNAVYKDMWATIKAGRVWDAFASQSNPGKRILISAFQAPDGDKALIRYRDNAGGIGPEIVGHIFEPFFSTKGEGGTGLGLSISKQVVEQHGGEIVCESAAGETEFRILLPATRAEKAPEESNPGSRFQMA